MSKRAHGAEALAHPCPVITSPMMRRTAPVEATRFVNSPLGKDLHLRGLNARVVKPGTIRTGDIARKL